MSDNDSSLDNRDVDLSTVFSSSEGVTINEGERLNFAKQILAVLAFICVCVFIARGYAPENEGVSQVFELVKIGALPLVTLVISFYFPNSSTK